MNNEQNILIIGDDLPVAASRQSAANQHPASIATPDQTAHEGSWLAGRTNALAETFLQQHQSEFHDFEQREREKTACAERFQSLETEINSRRQWLETLRHDIAEYQTLDLATVIFKNLRTTGRSLPNIAQDPQLSGAFLIQQHGPKILQLAEKEVADLQAGFNEFKSEKQEMLRDLGITYDV